MDRRTLLKGIFLTCAAVGLPLKHRVASSEPELLISSTGRGCPRLFDNFGLSIDVTDGDFRYISGARRSGPIEVIVNWNATNAADFVVDWKYPGIDV